MLDGTVSCSWGKTDVVRDSVGAEVIGASVGAKAGSGGAGAGGGGGGATDESCTRSALLLLLFPPLLLPLLLLPSAPSTKHAHLLMVACSADVTPARRNRLLSG
jgi:hypothetical protein